MYKPLTINGTIYVSKDGKHPFRDWNNDPLDFYDMEDAELWCESRNAIDKIM